MHPAFSVIVFTVISGAGYGLLTLIGLGALLGWLPPERGFALAAFGLAFTLTTGGLVASTFHLGHPERAWRALSQWRTSWLSREGVAALATYLPTGIFALLWLVTGRIDAGLGLIGAVLALVTIYCTAMIYASLVTVRQWKCRWVPAGYLIFGPMSGCLWLAFLARVFGGSVVALDLAALALLVAGGLAKLGYWRTIDRQAPLHSTGGATGLGTAGQVRLLDPPNTEENYLQREMGFRIARKHAAKLRRMALGLGFLLPGALIGLGCLLGGWIAVGASLLAAVAAMIGLLIERWLFFAEAKHTVMLYYGTGSM